MAVGDEQKDGISAIGGIRFQCLSEITTIPIIIR